MATTINQSKLAKLIAKIRAERVASTPFGESKDELQTTPGGNREIQISSAPEPIRISEVRDKYGNLITLNSKQQEFVDLAVSGKSCVLIGPAGTGKTTCQGATTQGIIQSGRAGILSSEGHKHLLSGTPGIVICAYTRRAVANIRRNMPAELQNNCITIHKLLEYQPVYYEVEDENTGQTKTTMKFEATRNAANPLPASIKVIFFEEGSMIGTDLHQEVINACPHDVQFIYLGDIQQLPPVFGPAILGFKLLELPVVELTEVYRQALESPIIKLAHRILSAKPIPAKEYDSWKVPGQLSIRPWKKKIAALEATITLGAVFKEFINKGIYDTEEDVILIPFNKSCGTDELNKIIANHLARTREQITWQIIAGFNKIHLSVGDKVLYEKEDATVVKIEKNLSYTGAQPLTESPTLDYWGHDPILHEKAEGADDEDAMDFVLAQTAAVSDEERVKKASHKVTLRLSAADQEVTIESAGELNSLILGYALTVHKSQGSEWRKVFLCFHQSHATMLQRELLYTAVTRAREELYIICEPETFTNGIISQRVKGDTLEEKAEYFKGKLEKEKEMLK